MEPWEDYAAGKIIERMNQRGEFMSWVQLHPLGSATEKEFRAELATIIATACPWKQGDEEELDYKPEETP